MWNFFLFVFGLSLLLRLSAARLQKPVESIWKLCCGRAYLDFNPERFVFCGSPLIECSTFCSNPVSNNLESGLPNGIVTFLGKFSYVKHINLAEMAKGYLMIHSDWQLLEGR